jgi:hypothetical protein
MIKSRVPWISRSLLSTCGIVVETLVGQSGQVWCGPRSDERPRTSRGPTASPRRPVGPYRAAPAPPQPCTWHDWLMGAPVKRSLIATTTKP